MEKYYNIRHLTLEEIWCKLFIKKICRHSIAGIRLILAHDLLRKIHGLISTALWCQTRVHLPRRDWKNRKFILTVHSFLRRTLWFQVCQLLPLLLRKNRSSRKTHDRGPKLTFLLWDNPLKHNVTDILAFQWYIKLLLKSDPIKMPLVGH